MDAGTEASELELLRTVALSLGVRWGKDDLGWWAAVPDLQIPTHETTSSPVQLYTLFREDDNGARFKIDQFSSRSEAELLAAELAQGGHKQHYFIEP